MKTLIALTLLMGTFLSFPQKSQAQDIVDFLILKMEMESIEIERKSDNFSQTMEEMNNLINLYNIEMDQFNNHKNSIYNRRKNVDKMIDYANQIIYLQDDVVEFFEYWVDSVNDDYKYVKRLREERVEYDKWKSIPQELEDAYSRGVRINRKNTRISTLRSTEDEIINDLNVTIQTYNEAEVPLTIDDLKNILSKRLELKNVQEKISKKAVSQNNLERITYLEEWIAEKEEAKAIAQLKVAQIKEFEAEFDDRLIVDNIHALGGPDLEKLIQEMKTYIRLKELPADFAYNEFIESMELRRDSIIENDEIRLSRVQNRYDAIASDLKFKWTFVDLLDFKANLELTLDRTNSLIETGSFNQDELIELKSQIEVSIGSIEERTKKKKTFKKYY